MKNYLLAALVSTTMLFTSLAQAMQIERFDRMAVQDQGDYIQGLVDGAQKVLIDEGRRDLAAKVLQLFTETPTGDKLPLGLTEFEINLARVRLVDAKNVEANHNATRLEVEHVMILTLKDNGIVLPKSIMTVMSGFKPKFPPQDAKRKRNNSQVPATSKPNNHISRQLRYQIPRFREDDAI